MRRPHPLYAALVLEYTFGAFSGKEAGDAGVQAQFQMM